MPNLPQDSLLPTPKVVAIATDTYITPVKLFPDPANLPGVPAPRYGQDITFGFGRAAPRGQSVGTVPADLKKKMRKLLSIFASGDRSGMANRLFTAFMSDANKSVGFFDDPSLNDAASRHANIQTFCSAALSAPNSPKKSAGKLRIHQALKNAGWDIAKLAAPADLGVPAFNIGNQSFQTGDFSNGLGVMINGVQHVYVFATHYKYNPKDGTYVIRLRFIFYDVFGLDDDDLAEFGAASDSLFALAAPVGITAWWQLQHQHGHAPLVTRIILEQTHECPAT